MEERGAGIANLHELYVVTDRPVAAAYRRNYPLTDSGRGLDPGHGFHETAQGVRLTTGETARWEVLGRLLELNHQRHAEEIAVGLHKRGEVPR